MTPEEIAADEAQTARNENAANRYAKCQRLGVNPCGYEIVDGVKYYDWEWMDPQEYEEIMAIVEDPSIQAEDVELHPYVQWQEDLIFQQSLKALMEETRQKKAAEKRKAERKRKEKIENAEAARKERHELAMANLFGNHQSPHIEDCLFEYKGEMGFSAKDLQRFTEMSSYKLSREIQKAPIQAGIIPVFEMGPRGVHRGDWFVPEESVEILFGPTFRERSKAAAAGLPVPPEGPEQVPEEGISYRSLAGLTGVSVTTLKKDAGAFAQEGDILSRNTRVSIGLAAILVATSGYGKGGLKERLLNSAKDVLEEKLVELIEG